MPATARMSASLNSPLTPVTTCCPAEEPSSPTPMTTPVTASHSRQDSSRWISQAATTAVTARLAAMMAWTANSGRRRSAMSWATNPTRSSARLAMKRHWCSIRSTRPGSTRPSATLPPADLGGAPARGPRGHGLHDAREAVAQRRHHGGRQTQQHGSDPTPDGFSSATKASSAGIKISPPVTKPQVRASRSWPGEDDGPPARPVRTVGKQGVTRELAGYPPEGG